MARRTLDSNPTDTLRRTLRKDDKWARYVSVYRTAYRPEFDGYIDEIQTLHRTRSTRVLGAQSAPSGKKIADAAMRDQSTRSRCVEISMEVVRQRNHLAIVMNTVQSYILTEYGRLLYELGFTAVKTKEEAVLSLFGAGTRKIQELDTITEIANMVINDVDQASWAIKSTVTALEVATAREKSY